MSLSLFITLNRQEQIRQLFGLAGRHRLRRLLLGIQTQCLAQDADRLPLPVAVGAVSGHDRGRADCSKHLFQRGATDCQVVHVVLRCVHHTSIVPVFRGAVKCGICATPPGTPVRPLPHADPNHHDASGQTIDPTPADAAHEDL